MVKMSLPFEECSLPAVLGLWFDRAPPFFLSFFFFFFCCQHHPPKGTEVAYLRAREGTLSRDAGKCISCPDTSGEGKCSSIQDRMRFQLRPRSQRDPLAHLSPPCIPATPSSGYNLLFHFLGSLQSRNSWLVCPTKGKTYSPQSLFHCLAMFLSYYCSFF